MARYGYARVSTTDQNLGPQLEALQKAGCEVIRSEQVTGTSVTKRLELRNILDFVRAGDVLVVTRIDRLARSLGDLQDIVRELQGKGAALVVIEQNVDTSTAAGKAFFDMLGVFAEFETNLRAERQKEGIAAAKAAGVYNKPRRPRGTTVDHSEVYKSYKEIGGTETAKKFGLSIGYVFSLAAKYKKNEGEFQVVP